MRAYIDGVLPMKQIVSIDDEEIRSCEEPITAIVCENPAELDTLHDFLLKNTNIADLRTKVPNIDGGETDLATLLESFGVAPHQKTQQGSKHAKEPSPTTPEQFGRIGKMAAAIRDKRDLIRELETTIETNNNAIDGLKSMLANSRKHNNRQAKEIKEQNTTIDGLEATRRGLLVTCDKRNTLLVAVLKDLKSGVARDWIENDLDTAMEEL